jgi:hypothetical protein
MQTSSHAHTAPYAVSSPFPAASTELPHVARRPGGAALTPGLGCMRPCVLAAPIPDRVRRTPSRPVRPPPDFLAGQSEGKGGGAPQPEGGGLMHRLPPLLVWVPGRRAAAGLLLQDCVFIRAGAWVPAQEHEPAASDLKKNVEADKIFVQRGRLGLFCGTAKYESCRQC